MIIPTAIGAWFLFLSLALLGRVQEWHHGYLGLLLIGAGIFWTPLQYAGLVLLADDAVQHCVQLAKPAFRGPLWRLYAATLWKIPFIQRLNALLDRVL